jgi:hypothetical protein
MQRFSKIKNAIFKNIASEWFIILETTYSETDLTGYRMC